MAMRVMLTAALSLTVPACAKKNMTPAAGSPDAPASRDGSISGLSYRVTAEDAPGLQLTSAEVGGSGTLLFHASPGPAEASVVYDLAFAAEDGGSVVLISHASPDLTDGTIVPLARQGTDLVVQARDKLTTLTATPAGGEITLQVTIRNGETPPHVTVAGTETLFDSVTDGVSFQRGPGDRFGVRLNRATLKHLGFALAPADSGHDDHDRPQSFTVSDLHAVNQKALKRFERMALSSATFESTKTWKTSQYIWVRLTWSLPDAAAANGRKNEHFLLACHFHGNELGCHKKDEPGPDEPADDDHTDDLPDDDLPPLAET
jgi:hypothetical protein